MKKPLLLLTFFLLMQNLLFATSVESNPKPVCSESELSSVIGTRFVNLAMHSLLSSAVFYDTQTIKVDSKNKIIEVWVLYILSKEGQQSYLTHDGQKDIGYAKNFLIIDYAQMRIKLKAFHNFTCRGDVKGSWNATDKQNWEMIAPGSTYELITQTIMQNKQLK